MELIEQKIDIFIENLSELRAIFESLQISMTTVENKLEILQTEIKKSFPNTFQKSILFSGGIIGGERDRGIRGKREGGNKGGGILQKNGDALKDYSDDEIQFMETVLAYLCSCSFISDSQRMYLKSREQKIISLKALRKLRDLKYSEDNIRQAIYNASRDSFWSQKFRHIKALANTSKNGCLVIDNLLNINKNQTKISSPRTIVF